MLQIPSLERLVHELSRLPGVGPKTAQRLAYHILRDSAYSERLRGALKGVEEKVQTCPRCFSFTEEELCRYCQDLGRSEETLCVVEEPMDILGIESSGAFRGRYHVLHGVISPLEGVSPEDIHIKELIERVDEGLIQEVILALDADLEGDTTVLYLSKLLAEKKVKLTRIAQGVPIGSDMDYIDHRTIGRALENRIEI